MNKKVILKQRPVGEPKLEDFELFEEDIRDPKDAEVSLKTISWSANQLTTHSTVSSSMFTFPWNKEEVKNEFVEVLFFM